jgi:hypothetical protein
VYNNRTRGPVRISGSAMLLTALFFGGASRGERQGQGEMAVSFDLRSPSVTLHEPVLGNLSVHNGMTDDVSVDLGYDREGALEFSIVQPDGSTVTLPRVPRRNGASRVPELSLQQGETYVQELVLNKWYPFNKPGSYTIRVRLVTTIRSGSDAPVKAEFSQEMSLQVGERDEQRLENVCKDLAAAAMQTNAETALGAAHSLSYVEDVVAVPYLVRLTKQGPFKVVTKNIALEGLGRIARSEGLDAVMSRLSPEDQKWEAVIKAEAGQ